jgi:transposase
MRFSQIWRSHLKLNLCITFSPLAMARSILVRPKGGATGKVRKRYAVVEKIMLLEEYGRLQQGRNLSLTAAAEELGVNKSLLSRWKKDITRLQANIKSPRKRAIVDGPNGQLHSIEEELLMWIFARREQGISIRHTIVSFKASALLRTTFGQKTFNARYKAVQRFMRKHKYVYRMRTNEATRAPQEVIDEATDFIAETRPLLVGPHRDPRWILNMDQTPLHFSYQSSKTLAKRGAKTVNVRKTTDGTKRATLALTVTAAGDFLTPMIVFKGEANGHIAKKELPTHDPTSIYACQKAAWMDERCMKMWVDQILAPYLSTNPPPTRRCTSHFARLISMPLDGVGRVEDHGVGN